MSQSIADFKIPKGAIELCLFQENGCLQIDFRDKNGETIEGHERTLFKDISLSV